jgi:hypothetical protein
LITGRADGRSPSLLVRRPDEGQRAELELALVDPGGRQLGRGRVPIDRGYLAVLREVRRQLHDAGLIDGGGELGLEIELRLQEDGASGPDAGAASESGAPG